MKKEDREFIDSLKQLHNDIKDFLNKKDFSGLKTFINLKGELNINELKTVLIITKSFKQHEQLGEQRAIWLQQFEDKRNKSVY